MHIVVHNSISELDPAAWNAMLDDGNPFLHHEFLSALESSGCTVSETGWTPTHICAYTDDSDQLIGALPCYLKTHSYGEYIFDWAWSNAFHQHGIEYYPKLSNSVPFTPATGSRILTNREDTGQRQTIAEALINKAKSLCTENSYSSFHSLFHAKDESAFFSENGLLARDSSQFHWNNSNYRDFDAFLSKMSSKKRKNIKRERRRVLDSGIDFNWYSGQELDWKIMRLMYEFYQKTTRYYGAQQYLNRQFFEALVEDFSERTMVLIASLDNHSIAGGLYFRGDNTLYGRYWGAANNFHSLHFETCYYQPIQWCIENNYDSFEAGAQGEHKLARGLEPVKTSSSHWIEHPEFRRAIGQFLHSESEHISDYQRVLSNHSPFKKDEV